MQGERRNDGSHFRSLRGVAGVRREVSLVPKRHPCGDIGKQSAFGPGLDAGVAHFFILRLRGFPTDEDPLQRCQRLPEGTQVWKGCGLCHCAMGSQSVVVEKFYGVAGRRLAGSTR